MLKDEAILLEVQELVESGASIGTVEAKLDLPKGRLRQWLTKGEQQPNTPYRTLYRMFRKWAGEARAVAEANQLAKTPGQWLESNSSSRLLDDEDAPKTPTTAITTTGPMDANGNFKLGAQAALAAISALVESGISIDESVRKGQIMVEDKLPEDQ